MLELTRRQSQTLLIGDDIELTIVQVRGESVRIGITAPKEVPIHRGEVYEAIQEGRGRDEA